MANLMFKLSRAVAAGRADKGVPKDRAEILVALLRKRAEAHRQGLGDQEKKLRDQIKWALPVQDGEPAFIRDEARRSD
jgi:protein involved in temperature-dependent protein secretion